MDIQQKPTGVKALTRGLGLPLRGWRFMGQHPKLWRYGWFPILLNTAVTLSVLVGGFWAQSWVFRYFFPDPIVSWWGQALVVLAFVVTGILLLGMAVAVGVALSLILCGYFYGRLAMAVERELGTDTSELTELSLWVETIEAIWVLWDICWVNTLLFGLSFIPAAGPVLAGGLGWYWNSYLLGAEFFDYPLMLRGWRRRRRRGFAKHNRLVTVGLGTWIFFLNMIPVVGAFVLTTAVVGACLARAELPEPPKKIKQK